MMHYCREYSKKVLIFVYVDGNKSAFPVFMLIKLLEYHLLFRNLYSFFILLYDKRTPHFASGAPSID